MATAYTQASTPRIGPGPGPGLDPPPPQRQRRASGAPEHAESSFSPAFSHKTLKPPERAVVNGGEEGHERGSAAAGGRPLPNLPLEVRMDNRPMRAARDHGVHAQERWDHRMRWQLP
jgi:hypothetical protein